jgi:hypothetical protein
MLDGNSGKSGDNDNVENKKALIPKQGQKLAGFCGATQIDDIIAHSFLYTNIYIPLITGRSPVSAYFPKDFGLPSQVHSEQPL